MAVLRESLLGCPSALPVIESERQDVTTAADAGFQATVLDLHSQQASSSATEGFQASGGAFGSRFGSCRRGWEDGVEVPVQT